MRAFAWTLLTLLLAAAIAVTITWPLAEPSVAPGAGAPSSVPADASPAPSPLPGDAGGDERFASPTVPPITPSTAEQPGIPGVDDRVIVTRVRPRRGPLRGGTEVTIHGQNLTAVTAVRFGDATAEVVSQSARKLVVISPAGTSSDPVNIVLEHPKGGVEAAVFRYER